MEHIDPVSLARLQFAMTALYHFLFVPLTLGLSFLLAIMESAYVMTGREIWRDMTRFWGKLFGINFAMGVATGITMEFQFGTNWAYYSHYVGDIFGAPLAIEGLMAFFLESTFVGLFFFGWDRMSKLGHLTVTWLVAIGSSLSALWILIANGWMQNPVGAVFNPDTMRMELSSFYDLMFNPTAQSKFVHTVSAGYVTGSIFMLAISAYYLLNNRHHAFAKRSIIVASAFGLASALSVVVLGDESGYTATENQKMKIAAMEAMWKTEPPPAPFTLFAVPDAKAQQNSFEIKVPWVLGIIATRSFDKPMPGIDDLVARAKERIKSGLVAYDAVEKLKTNRQDPQARADLAVHVSDLGYALLLKRYVADPRKADDGDNRQSRGRHGARRGAAVLELPRHGGLGLLLHRAVRRGVLLHLQARLLTPMAIEIVPVVAAAALARRRVGLVRRRIRPPALGDRRRAADVPRLVLGVERAGSVHALRLRPVLLVAFGRRRHPDAQVRAHGAGRGARQGAVARA